MKFYQRLDVQLTLIFVGVLSITVSLTGWIHSRGHFINLVGPYFHLTAELERLEPEIRTFEKDRNGKSLDALLQGFAARNPEKLFLVVNDNFQVIAQTTPTNSMIELVRKEPDPRYFVVTTSSIEAKYDFILIYQRVPGLEFESDGETLHLMVIPEPWIIDPGSMNPILFDGLRYHFGIFGWLYGCVIIFFVGFIRWRLRPLRRIELASYRLTERTIPEPIKGKIKNDEVGRLVTAFNTALSRLAENETTRQRMVSDIAHELRTPLTNLSGRIEAYEDQLIEDADSLIEFASSQVEDLIRIVNDLALLSSSDAGELTLEYDTFHLKQTLENLLDGHQLGQPFRWSVQGGDFEVLLDRHRFRQVIQNLIDNARKAKPEDLEIQLRCQRNAKGFVIHFEDNGPGVGEAHLERLFERLYRPDPSRSSRTGGSGLGLSIVKSLVEAQHGSITCYRTATGGLGFEMQFASISQTSLS